MTEAGREIIELLKKKQRFTFAGNREYFGYLDYEDDKFFVLNGDSMENKIVSKYKIDEYAAIEIVKDYFKSHSKIFEHKEISTDDEVLEYWKRWQFEG